MTRAAGGRHSIADLVAATPATRERYVDCLRAASIVVVMLGHWTIAVVSLQGNTVVASNLIAEVRGMWLATWLFQVMPVFFFVGGFGALVTLEAHRRRGEGYAAFTAGRARRLLRPVAVLLAAWLPVTSVVQALGVVPYNQLALATHVVTQLLWFIGVYFMVVALAPPMLALHRRLGAAVPVVLAAAAAFVDLLRFAAGIPHVGFLNFAFVWLFAQQLGFFYADGTLRRLPRPVLVGTAALALATLAVLTGFGPYPLSMVGLPGESVSNMNPPTVCLVAIATWQVALVMLARDAVSRWLERPRAWRAVIAINGVIMTMLLWHLSAMLLAFAALLPLGFPQAETGTPRWWMLKVAWIAIFSAVTAVFVLAFGRFERPRRATVSAAGGSALPAAIGMTLVIVGVSGFAVSGLVDFLHPLGRRLIVIPVSPAINLACLIAGAALVLRPPGWATRPTSA